MTQPFCNSRIKPGSTVLAMRDMHFGDGTIHKDGDVILVSEDTLAYFRLNCNGFNYIEYF
jgi:hypothetical protein